MSEIDTITLTTAHSMSSYGRPVLLVDGEAYAYGPADLVGDVLASDLVRQWAALFCGLDAVDRLAAELRQLAETNPTMFDLVLRLCRNMLDVALLR